MTKSFCIRKFQVKHLKEVFLTLFAVALGDIEITEKFSYKTKNLVRATWSLAFTF